MTGTGGMGQSGSGEDVPAQDMAGNQYRRLIGWLASGCEASSRFERMDDGSKSVGALASSYSGQVDDGWAILV